MDNQGSGIRKIVLKHRSLGKTTGHGDVVSDVNHQGVRVQVAEDERDSENIENALHYQGEIFDQFYRPLSAFGGDVRLAELAQEPLLPTKSRLRLSEAEVLARDQSYRQAAEALAKQIYNLAQVVRESDVDVYLSAFNVVLANHDCHDSLDILERANSYFTESYYNEIRERGERPDIISQIVKRVGHAVADRVGRIAGGLNVGKVAAELWSTFHGPLPHRMKVIEDRLLDCTERQARALRSEFLLVPYRDIARQIREIVSESLAEVAAPSKRPSSRTELYDSKRQQALQARAQLRGLRYLLLGRSEEEVALIKKFYIELDESERPESEKSLETALSKQFQPSELERLGSLLVGWSAQSEAEEFHRLIYPDGFDGEIRDFLSDPRDAVDRDYGQGIGPFLRRFRKRRMWLGKTDVRSRVLNVYEILAERVAALSIERFLLTNEALIERYGYELDLNWFPSSVIFDARTVAAILHDRIAAGYDFFEIVRPVEFYGPRECLAIQRAYAAQFGAELKDALDARLNQVRDKTLQAEREVLYARYLDGRGRWPLAVDLLARYKGAGPEPTEWCPEFVPTPQEQELAIKLAAEVDTDAPKGSVDGAIAEILEPLDPHQLRRIERTFLEMTDPPLPLARALSDVLSAEAFDRYNVAIYGIRLEEMADRIAGDPLTLVELRYLPVAVIKIVRSYFQMRHAQKLDLFVMAQFSHDQDEDVAIDLLSIVYTPEAHLFRPAIQEFRRDIPAHLDGLRRFWARDLLGRMGMERAIDLQFTRFRVLVKHAAARNALLPAVLAEIVLSFEGISPDLTGKIVECFDAVDIERLLSLLRLTLRNQRTVEEVYDLLFPDLTLRDTVKAMRVDADLINETLLHLDGFSAQVVAEEIHEIALYLSGAELGEELVALLSPSSEHRCNPRIPDDVNWMDEMMYQIGLAHERLYGTDLFEVCVRRDVPLRYLHQLAIRIFGSEVCATASDLYQLVDVGRRGGDIPDGLEERLCSFLESRGSRHRERIVRAYAAYWARLPGCNPLVEDFGAFVRESPLKRKILAIVSAVGQR